MKRKGLYVGFFALVCMAAHAAVPQISGVTVTQDAETLRVTVSYALSAPAIVTARLSTNGVAVAGRSLPAFAGDVNVALPASAADAPHTFVWYPPRTWEGVHVAEDVQVELTAWPLAAPPDYLVADLRFPHVRYFPCAEDLPDGGLASDVYRLDCMVFRRIPAAGASFTMGASETEPGYWLTSNNYSRETLRRVSFTNDFWLGVFEVTQYQWWRIANTWPSAFSNAAVRATRPVESVAYSTLRGNTWPAGGYDGAAGLIPALRARTGLKIDLPTEAQWEFACRAGTQSGFNNGRDVMGDMNQWNESARFEDPALDAYGRYNGNGGRHEDGTAVDRNTADLSEGTARVGSYEPNAWGLYDMHGNVGEFCLDLVNMNAEGSGMLPTTDVVEPTGPALDATLNPYSARVTRGGSYNFSSWCCRSAIRRFQAGGQHNFGFRLAIQK